MRLQNIAFIVLVCLISASPLFAERHMIHTYWHELDGPYWVYKPQAISVAGDHIYTIGSNKDIEFRTYVYNSSTDDWTIRQRNSDPPNYISACNTSEQDAYYTSPGNDVFVTDDAGATWDNSPLNPPPGNTEFAVCAANPFNADKALVGCGIDAGGNPTIWKTEDHGDHWASMTGYTNYPVTDIEWYPQQGHGNKFFIGLDGAEGDCFYFYDGANFLVRPIYNVDLPIAKVACFDVKYFPGDENPYIVAMGYGDDQWALLWSTTNGEFWHGGPIQAPLPPEITSETRIRDIKIYDKVQSGNPGIYMATDIGIFMKDINFLWQHIYNNEADKSVFSIGYWELGNDHKVYAGTVHSLLVTENDQDWTRIQDVMFEADLKSSWSIPQSDGITYTLNTKTGAIFTTELDFSDLYPGNENPQINLINTELTANISGIDGEFDGMALAADGNTILASSKNENGDGKLIRFYGSAWQELDVPGDPDPAFEALAVNGSNMCAAFGEQSGSIYYSANCTSSKPI